MTDSFCSYSRDRGQEGEAARAEALIAAVYRDGDPVLLASFDTHVASCERCRAELVTLGGVRAQLARWSPPEPSFEVFSRPPAAVSQQASAGSRDPESAISTPRSTTSSSAWWRQVPAWAQVAAALLFLGVSAGIANLDVRYDANGLSIRTGWSSSRDVRGSAADRTLAASPVPGAQPSVDAAPWRADLAALEQQMKNEMRVSLASATAAATTPHTVSASDAEVIRRVRALVDESEKRQQRELALRVAEVLRDVNSQRQADLVKIDRSLGAVQNNLGVEVMKQRQSLNLLYRASQRQ